MGFCLSVSSQPPHLSFLLGDRAAVLLKNATPARRELHRREPAKKAAAIREPAKREPAKRERAKREPVRKVAAIRELVRSHLAERAGDPIKKARSRKVPRAKAASAATAAPLTALLTSELQLPHR